MDCTTAESMMNRYIEKKLPLDDMEDFLNHVEMCDDCYNELESYFIADEAIRQLDAGDDQNFDFRKRLANQIHRSRQQLARRQILRFAGLTAVLVFGAAVITWVLFQLLA